MKAMVSLRDVAAALGISYSKVYELVQQGQIEAVKIGWVYRIEPAEVERFKRAHAVRPKATSAQPRKRSTAPTTSRTRAEECAALGIPVDHEFV